VVRESGQIKIDPLQGLNKKKIGTGEKKKGSPLLSIVSVAKNRDDGVIADQKDNAKEKEERIPNT